MTPQEFAAQLRQPVRGTPYVPHRKDAPKHPSGWEPGVAWDGSSRTITGVTESPDIPDWDRLVQHFGFDPETVEVDGRTVQCRSWEVPVRQEDGSMSSHVLYYYRAVLREKTLSDRTDVDELIKEIRRKRPLKPRENAVGADSALVVALADWQTGKGEGGGTPETVKRILGMIDSVADRIRAQKVHTLYVLGMGDLVEGCDGHYAVQTFSVDLDRRDQVKVVRRLLVRAVDTWAPLVQRVVFAAVAGNHGEHRKDGKIFTSFADNDDVAVVEQVAEICAANPDRYGHVSFVLPTDELAITLDISGQTVAIAHGHQARAGGIPQAKIAKWWTEQSFGQTPAGDADILVTGHYHHLSVIEHGGRTHFQCPAMDGGSKWYSETRGIGGNDRRGTLTFVVDSQGWRGLEVL